MLHLLPLVADDPDRAPLVESLAPRWREPDHLAFVRSQGCAVRTRQGAGRCQGPIQAHHVRTAANSGMALKPPDSCAVGLCHGHHRALHDLGRRTFERSYGVDLADIAAQLWQLGKEPACP